MMNENNNELTKTKSVIKEELYVSPEKDNVDTAQDIKKRESRMMPIRRYSDLNIYKGGGVIAVRMDGRNYTSKDSNLPDDVRDIIKRTASGESVKRIISDYQGRGSFSGKRKKLPSGKFGEFVESLLNIYGLIILVLVLILAIQLIGILK